MGMPPAKFHLAVSSLSWLVWQPHIPAHVGLILLQPQKPHGRLRSYQFPPLWESLPVSTYWLMRSWGRALWRNTTNIAKSCWCTTNSAVLYKDTGKLTNSGGLRDVSIKSCESTIILTQLNASMQSQFGKDGLQPQIQYTKSYSRYTVCIVQAVSEGRPTSNPDPTKPTASLMKLEQLALRVSVVVCSSTSL